jgi:ubiquinol-cytochrome c reductase subunit 7
MLKQTPVALNINGAYAGFRYFFFQFVNPNGMRDQLALLNANKVERGVRLQTALRANKVDLRTLLALPVTDSAHPYKSEFPWEKVVARVDHRNVSLYGRWYRAKILATYEALQFHKWGCYVDDVVNMRGWWNRAARTRMPQHIMIHQDRRVVRARSLKDKYLYDKKENWVKPSDNTPFFGPYITMVADEWEEKWGFFAGHDTEY